MSLYHAMTWAMLRDFLLLYAVTFLIMLPYLCQSLRHSWYFMGWKSENDARHELESENSARTIQSEQFLKELQPEKPLYSPTDNTDKMITVTIAIITHARTRYFPEGTNPRYLSQTVASFLKILQQTDSKMIHFNMFICNVDPDPVYHKEALSLSKVATVINRFTIRSLPMVHPKEKEKQDYQFCLNKTLTFDADFAFLVEDDALPRTDVIQVLEKILQHYFADKPKMTTISYIKFYHPERLLGYLSGSIDGILQLIALSGLLALLSQYVIYYHRRKSLSLLLFFLYFMLCALSIGRTNLLQVFHLFSPYLYSTVPAPSCCTQAILYSRPSAFHLLEHLQGATCGNNLAKDDIIESWSHEHNLNAYLVQPETFKHIGMYSALRNQIVNPFLL